MLVSFGSEHNPGACCRQEGQLMCGGRLILEFCFRMISSLVWFCLQPTCVLGALARVYPGANDFLTPLLLDAFVNLDFHILPEVVQKFHLVGFPQRFLDKLLINNTEKLRTFLKFPFNSLMLHL